MLRVLKTRCLKMVTFEKHILNTLNAWLEEKNIRGEFYFIKSYKKGVFAFQKIVTMTLHFKSGSEDIICLEGTRKFAVQEADMLECYDEMFEQLLYKLLFDKKLWNSISTRLQ